MDSFAATRNLIKGGGPVPALCDLVKRIWHLCDEHGVSLHPEWVPREENTQADRLSKAWENWYLLKPDALEQVRKLRAESKHRVHREAEVLNVPFNQIRNVLHAAKADKRSVCIVYPAWTAQSWMQVLKGAEVAYVRLGQIQSVLTPPPKGSPLEGCPQWRVDASIVDFTRA
jgi:hypothetical protein